MQTGAITGYIDVAQLALYTFWLAFAGLIFYLRREDKREGYPLVSDRSRYVRVQGLPTIPAPKTFLTQHGPVYRPRIEPADVLNANTAGMLRGGPLEPTGNPMLAGMGPGAHAQRRADIPDYTFDDNLPKIVPLRAAPEFFLAWEDPDVIGMAVYGDDGVQAGTVSDAWVDRSEVMIRYLEVSLLAPKGADRVLLPMNFARIKGRQRSVHVRSILASQFADVPTLKSADTITFLEEEKIVGYYGGGTLYATASRSESLL